MDQTICSICSDLFDDTSAIAAISCGHTFHHVCLTKWLDNKNSCPHCRTIVKRNNIITKLYFDKVSNEEVCRDGDRLANELSDVRVKLMVMTKERDEAQKVLAETQRTAMDLVLKQSEDQDRIKRLQSDNKSLNTKVLKLEIVNKDCMQKVCEANKVKEYTVQMQNLDALLKGSYTAAQSMLAQYQNASQLATLCAALKQEYENLKTEKRALKYELEDIKKSTFLNRQSVVEQQDIIADMKKEIHKRDGDILSVEIKYNKIKRKYEKLKQSCGRRCVTPNSVNSSKQPSSENYNAPVACTTPVATPRSADFQSPILFDDSVMENKSNDDSLILMEPTEEVVTPKFAVTNRDRLRAECIGNDVSFVNFSKPNLKLPLYTEVSDSSLKENNVVDCRPPAKPCSLAKQPSRVRRDNTLSVADYNIFKNSKSKCCYNSAIRVNYNGLGGHSKFTQSTRHHSKKASPGSLGSFLSKHL